MTIQGMSFIAELETNVWIAKGNGDPARTIVKKNARKFKTHLKAEREIINARKYRAFLNAKIYFEGCVE